MPSPIQRDAVGLQGLFGNRQFGSNPTDFLQGVVPTVDVLPHYGKVALKSRLSSGSAAAPGQFASIQLADDEVQMLIGISVKSNASGAAGNIAVSVRWTNVPATGASGSNTFIFAKFPVQTLAIGDIYAGSVLLPRPILLRNKDRIAGFYDAQSLGGGLTSELCLLTYELTAAAT